MIAVPRKVELVVQGEFLTKTEDEVRCAVVEAGETWLVELTDAVEFLAWLQVGFRPPTQGIPSSGLPAGVWAGVRLPYVDASGEPLRDVIDLLDVRARVRWVETPDGGVPERLLHAWRCSNCGTRGEEPRPRLCPHAGLLCGDAAIDPQVHVVMSDHVDEKQARVLRGLGISVWPSLATLGIRR